MLFFIVIIIYTYAFCSIEYPQQAFYATFYKLPQIKRSGMVRLSDKAILKPYY